MTNLLIGPSIISILLIIVIIKVYKIYRKRQERLEEYQNSFSFEKNKEPLNIVQNKDFIIDQEENDLGNLILASIILDDPNNHIFYDIDSNNYPPEKIETWSGHNGEFGGGGSSQSWDTNTDNSDPFFDISDDN